jgi:hypothetical protein
MSRHKGEGALYVISYKLVFIAIISVIPFGTQVYGP